LTFDPGSIYGINEVNVLHLEQSYTVEVDKCIQCCMVLVGKIKHNYARLGKYTAVIVCVSESKETEETTTKRDSILLEHCG